MRPKRHMIEEALPIALDDVEHRIQAEIDLVLGGDDLLFPEDRGEPEAEGDEDLDDVGDVLDKDPEGREQPAEAQEQEEERDHVVEGLQPVEMGLDPVGPDDRHDDEEEDGVDDDGRVDLDDGEDGDPELDLLDQKGVSPDHPGAGADGVGEEVVGDLAGEEIGHERDVAAGFDFQPQIEHCPHDAHHGQGLQKGPQQTKKRTGVTVLEVPARQVVDLLAALVYLADELDSLAC